MHHLMVLFDKQNDSSLISCGRGGKLIAITGRMTCGIPLAGRKNELMVIS